MTSRCKWPEPFRSLVKFRKKQGFNAIQIVVGILPETEAFSPDAKNSEGYPFNKDFSVNKKYFKEADLKIKYLITQGMVPVIFGGWGHHIDWMGEEAVKNLWREIIKRYSEYPVIYCLCGEVDGFLNSKYKITRPSYGGQKSKIQIKIQKFISRFIVRDEKELLKERLKNWDRVAGYIKSLDRKTLLTVHPQSMVRASELFGDPDWLDIDAIQSGHDKERTSFLVDSALQKNKKPFINLEPWYEGIMGNINDEDIRYAFWMSVLSGAAGMGYGAHGVWQMSDRDNFMGHWGKSDWKKAIKFTGAKQIGLAKRFLEKLEWWNLKPNLNLIDPHFNSNKTKLPVASENKENIVIYFPAGFGRYKFSLKGNFREQKWIDPVNCEMISGKGWTKSFIIPKVLRGRDAVCVIYKG